MCCISLCVVQNSSELSGGQTEGSEHDEEMKVNRKVYSMFTAEPEVIDSQPRLAAAQAQIKQNA